jgi:hypothetical protein
MIVIRDESWIAKQKDYKKIFCKAKCKTKNKMQSKAKRAKQDFALFSSLPAILHYFCLNYSKKHKTYHKFKTYKPAPFQSNTENQNLY